MSLVLLATVLARCIKVEKVVVVMRRMFPLAIKDCDERGRIDMVDMQMTAQRIELVRLERML